MAAENKSIDAILDPVIEPPTSADGLINLIRLRRMSMPQKLRAVADFIIERAHEVPIHSITELARMLDIAPSAIVRFAKLLGFSGFSEMQRLLRSQAITGQNSYVGLTSKLTRPGAGQVSTIGHVLDAFFDANISALQACRAEVDVQEMEKIVEAMASANLIAVIGQKRAFPLASYLFYGLSMLGCKTVLFDGPGGLLQRQAAILDKNDVLITISFAKYAEDVIATARAAKEANVEVIAITDSKESPLADIATRALFVQDSNLNGIRSISVTSTILQSLFVGLGIRIENKQTLNKNRENNARYHQTEQ